MADYGADIIILLEPLGPPRVHLIADVDNEIALTSLDIQTPRVDSVFVADGTIKADDIVTGVLSTTRKL